MRGLLECRFFSTANFNKIKLAKIAEKKKLPTVFPKINARGVYFFIRSLGGAFILDRRLF